MDEKVRVLMPIEVPNLDEDVDMDSIWQELNNYVKTLIPQINIQDLDGWNLLILVNSRSTNGVGVSKLTRRYPSDKEFEISISITIPNDDQAPYGLSKVKDGFYVPLNEKYSYIIVPDFNNYDNLYQYILENSKLAIDLAFSYGFTCNGKKIKISKIKKGQKKLNKGCC